MPRESVKVVFDGLMLFCQSAAENRYCEVGVQTRAAGHRVEIAVLKDVGARVEEVPLTAAQLPKKRFEHDDFRRYEQLFLYAGTRDTVPPRPEPSSIRIASSFSDLLDIQGPDFYPEEQHQADIAERWYKPSLFITTGELSGKYLTSDGEFCRLDEATVVALRLREIRASEVNDAAWDVAEKMPLGKFARHVETTINLDEGQSLVLRGRGDNELIFNLPRPSDLNVETYQVKISNLDVRDGGDYADADINCPAFRHHSRAFLNTAPTYYSLYPTDITRFRSTRDNPQLFTPELKKETITATASVVTNTTSVVTNEACCLSCRGTRTATLLPNDQTPWAI